MKIIFWNGEQTGGGGSLKSKIKEILADNGDLEGGIKVQTWIDRATTKLLALVSAGLPENQRYKGEFSTFANFESSLIYQTTTLTDYVFITNSNELFRLQSIGAGGVKNWVSITAEIKSRVSVLETLLDSEADVDGLVNKISEVLAVFQNYPEGINVLQEFNNIKANILLKQNITDNSLNTIAKTITGSINELKTSNDGKANQTTTYTKTETNTLLDIKVDKETGKGLSKNDLTDALKQKLDAIESQATKNETDSNLKARANHTGTQTASTISDFQANVSLNTDVIIGKLHDIKNTEANILTNTDILNVGKFAFATDTRKEYIGINNAGVLQWQLITDISKEDKTNKANNLLSPNATSYPTTQAVANAVALKQNTINREANSEAEMLALTGLVAGDIIIRKDINSLYRLKILPSNVFINWAVVSGNAPAIPNIVINRVYTSGALPTINGTYAFASGTPPVGAVGDILKLTDGVWTIEETFTQADSTLYSILDGATYNKKINSNGAQTWAVASAPSFYEVRSTGDNTMQGGFTTLTSAVDKYVLDGVSVGSCFIYDSSLTETATINANNFHISGTGTQYRSQTQISKIILGANSNRITLEKISLTHSSSLVPLEINSTGNVLQSGVNVGRGRHILKEVSFSTAGTTAVCVNSIENFLTFDSCDFGNKIVDLKNRTGTTISVSFNNCTNGVVDVGNGYIVSKINSPNLQIGTASPSSPILDFDKATPVAYSFLRTYSALGVLLPVAIGSLIVNDDIGGSFEIVKCKTAYTIAVALGVGTPINLTNYDVFPKENIANKNASNGYVGLTGFKINLKNALNTFTSLFSNTNTASREYIFQDRNGTIADNTDLALKQDKINTASNSNSVLMVNSLGTDLEFANKGTAFNKNYGMGVGQSVEGSTLFDNAGLIKDALISNSLKTIVLSVANQTQRFALTTAQVQNNDFVKQIDTGIMHFVKDQTNLDNANGYGLVPVENTDQVLEGSSNLYFTQSRVISSLLTGITTAISLAKLTTLNSIKEGFDLVNKIIDEVNLKINTTAIRTSFLPTPLNTNIASEKLIKDSLDLKANLGTDNILTGKNTFNGEINVPNTPTANAPTHSVVLLNGVLSKIDYTSSTISYIATSTTSNIIASSGNLNFTINTGLSIISGQKLTLFIDANNYMVGEINTYNITTGALVIAIYESKGSGTGNLWNIQLANFDFANIVKVPNTKTIQTSIFSNRKLSIHGTYTENVLIDGIQDLSIEGEGQTENFINTLQAQINGTLSIVRTGAPFPDRIKLKNFTQNGAVSFASYSAGGFFVAENIIFKNAITINISGLSAVNFKFVNCRFEGAITVSNGIVHTIIFKGCDLNNQTITNVNAVVSYEACRNIFSAINVIDTLNNGTARIAFFNQARTTIFAYFRASASQLAIAFGGFERIIFNASEIIISQLTRFTAKATFDTTTEFKGVNTYTSTSGNIHYGPVYVSNAFNNNANLFVVENSRIGIGTVNPACPLDVFSTAAFNYTRGAYIDYGGVNNSQNVNETQAVSIIVSSRVLASAFIAISDKRIKNIIALSRSEEDLNVLNKIEITNYNHKDFANKGNKIYKKVIAQQIQEIYPNAISKGVDFIPDIYCFSKSIIKVENGFEIEAEKELDLKIGDKIRITTDLDKNEEYDILFVNENKFTINIPKENFKKEIFIFGKQVDDFLSVDYDALSMLNISATQELCKKIEKQENEIEFLKTQIEELRKMILSK